jgi:hypothetical protein
MAPAGRQVGGLDFYIRGKMDSTGRVVTGGAFNSGFNGDSGTMSKQ